MVNPQDSAVFDLPLPESGIIKHIIHISDIHIRIGSRSECRFNEYRNVFLRLLLKMFSLLVGVINLTKSPAIIPANIA